MTVGVLLGTPRHAAIAKAKVVVVVVDPELKFLSIVAQTTDVEGTEVGGSILKVKA